MYDRCSLLALSLSLAHTHYGIRKQCTNVSNPHAPLLLSLLLQPFMLHFVTLYVHSRAAAATAAATATERTDQYYYDMAVQVHQV
jgi:hypothetical protein